MSLEMLNEARVAAFEVSSAAKKKGCTARRRAIEVADARL